MYYLKKHTNNETKLSMYHAATRMSCLINTTGSYRTGNKRLREPEGTIGDFRRGCVKHLRFVERLKVYFL